MSLALALREIDNFIFHFLLGFGLRQELRNSFVYVVFNRIAGSVRVFSKLPHHPFIKLV
jgi:hypothetical protein